MRTRRIWGIFVTLILCLPVLWSGVAAEPVAAAACPCSVFDSGSPAVEVDDDPVELGMRFKSSESGYITAIKFYKTANNTGVHTGRLWDTEANNLNASVTFTNESATGWQTAELEKPFWIFADTEYIVSYTAPSGNWAHDPNVFSGGAQITNGPLTATGAGFDYTNGGGIHPGFTSTSNYWVDAVFENSSATRSLWGTTEPVPAEAPTTQFASEYEVGTRFTSSVDTEIIGVRYWGYKFWFHEQPVNLWQNGSLLATATYGELSTREGWFEMRFDNPVPITAGAEYVVSKRGGMSAQGAHGATPNYFTAPHTNDIFTVPVNGGVYVETATSAFPTAQTSTNYWVSPIANDEISASGSATAKVDVAPTMTFAVNGKTSACNGESGFVSNAGSPTGVALGRLNPEELATGAQEMTVTSNAANGFAVYVRGENPTQNFRSPNHNWTDASGAYGSASGLDPGEQFGFTFNDSTTNSSVSNPAPNTFMRLDSTDRAVMESGSSMEGTGCISFAAQTGQTTPPGRYLAKIYYTAVPAF